MATANPLEVSGDTVTATFQLTPEVSGEITLAFNGGAQQSAPFTLPAEQEPTVTIGSTGSGWELQTSAGVLHPGSSPNAFIIAAS